MANKVFSSGLPPYLIGSFLSCKELPAYAQTSKSLSRAARDSLQKHHYPAIQSFGSDTYLGKLALLPLENTEAGHVELVKRVRQSAIHYIESGRNALEAEDRAELKIAPDAEITRNQISNYTYDQLNKAGTIIQDRLLLESVDGIFELEDGLNNELRSQNSLAGKAAVLRNWLRNMPDIPPGELGWALQRAAAIGNVGIVHALLESERDIPPNQLSSALNEAVTRGNVGIVHALLESERDIPPDRLSSALNEAVARGNVGIVRAFLESERDIPPNNLGLALRDAVKTENLGIVHAFLESKRDISSEPMYWALSEAAEMGNLEIVHAFLESEREMPPNQLSWALNDAVETGNLAVVRAFLESERYISSEHLYGALNEAVKMGNREIVDAFLQSKRNIGLFDRSQAALSAVKHGRISSLLHLIGDAQIPEKPLLAAVSLYGVPASLGKKAFSLAKRAFQRCRRLPLRDKKV